MNPIFRQTMFMLLMNALTLLYDMVEMRQNHREEKDTEIKRLLLHYIDGSALFSALRVPLR